MDKGLAGVVIFGSMADSILPFLRRLGFGPASALAPEVTGLVICLSVSYLMVRGTLL